MIEKLDHKDKKKLPGLPSGQSNEILIEQQLDEVLLHLFEGNFTPGTNEAEEALNKLYPLALSIAQNLKTPQEFQELLDLAEISLKAGNDQRAALSATEKTTRTVEVETKEPNPKVAGAEALKGIYNLRQELEKMAGRFNQPLADLVGPAQEKTNRSNSQVEVNLTVLGSLLYQAVREALSKNTFQKLEGSPWPTALLEKGPSRGQAQLRPAIFESEPLLPGSEIERWSHLMWKQREELSDLDADALDLLSHVWLQQARSPGHYAVGDVDQFLTMRGLKPKQGGEGRRGGYEPEQRAEMLKALSHIQNLWLNMGQLESEPSKTKKTRPPRARSKNHMDANNATQEVQSKAFIITDRMGQLNLDGYMDVRRFIFQPGHLFAHYLYGPGRQIALLSARAIQYDPYRQKWEKRLARYLSWQWRNQVGRGDYLRPYQIANLLETIGEEVNHRYPSKTRERLEKALDTLQKDEVITGWQYDRWDEEATGRRGWIEEWMHSTLLIEPPELIKEAYQPLINSKLDETGPALASSQLHPITPETLELVAKLKQRRKALKLSQLQIAERLKIAQSYFSKLENGHLNPSPAIYKRLEEWLEATNLILS